MREVGKACGEKWKTMTYEEKVKYYDIATEKRAEFDRAMSEYIRRELSTVYGSRGLLKKKVEEASVVFGFFDATGNGYVVTSEGYG
ncbi:hypothetical protein DKX38_029360 [Salix brachista]|uniref:HMG box domain-containing protein n=1 Tax=Salix brachista TaxID=2182728 RepID=A0A5N5J0J5_9ROSI|nr:hypothetical protein DKX38_029360 [Salix brachista]